MDVQCYNASRKPISIFASQSERKSRLSVFENELLQKQKIRQSCFKCDRVSRYIFFTVLSALIIIFMYYSISYVYKNVGLFIFLLGNDDKNNCDIL